MRALPILLLMCSLSPGVLPTLSPLCDNFGTTRTLADFIGSLLASSDNYDTSKTFPKRSRLLNGLPI